MLSAIPCRCVTSGRWSSRREAGSFSRPAATVHIARLMCSISLSSRCVKHRMFSRLPQAPLADQGRRQFLNDNHASLSTFQADGRRDEFRVNHNGLVADRSMGIRRASRQSECARLEISAGWIPHAKGCSKDARWETTCFRSITRAASSATARPSFRGPGQRPCT